MSEATTVVSSVFENFLKQLEEQKIIDADGLKRLRETLLGKQDFKQESLQKALFGDEAAS